MRIPQGLRPGNMLQTAKGVTREGKDQVVAKRLGLDVADVRSQPKVGAHMTRKDREDWLFGGSNDLLGDQRFEL